MATANEPLDNAEKVHNAFDLLRSNIQEALEDGRPEILDAALRSLVLTLGNIETQYVRIFDE